MTIGFDEEGYPTEPDRLEAPGSIAPAAVSSETFYKTDNPEAILILGAGRIEPEDGAFWLFLLCGHYLFTAENTEHGFGTGATHVNCSKCREERARDLELAALEDEKCPHPWGEDYHCGVCGLHEDEWEEVETS